jgi:hypothetical protein
MKKACLYSSNNNSKYLQFIPLVVKNALSLNIVPVIVLINVPDEVSSKYSEYQKYFRYFNINDINDVFVAQIIRLFYPAILKEYDVVMINDIDLILLNHEYFHYCFETAYLSKKFVVGRKKSNQYFMRFNFANPDIWGKIFKIYNINDVYEALFKIYSFGIAWEQIKLY